MTEDADFADRYGPWSLVAGASEGVGAAYVHALAARGRAVLAMSSGGVMETRQDEEGTT